MKVKIIRNKLQVGRSVTVELLKPVRINGKPTHKFVFSTTLKTKLWAFGISRIAKYRLHEFWSDFEARLVSVKPSARDRIIAQVEAVIPRLSPADYADLKSKFEKLERTKAEAIKTNAKWRRSDEAKRLELTMEREDQMHRLKKKLAKERRQDWLASQQ